MAEAVQKIEIPEYLSPSKAADMIVKMGKRAGLNLRILMGNEGSYPMDILSSEGWGICWYMSSKTVCVASAFDEETGMIVRCWPSRCLLRYPESQDRERRCKVMHPEAMVPFILDHLSQIRRLHERSSRHGV